MLVGVYTIHSINIFARNADEISFASIVQQHTLTMPQTADTWNILDTGTQVTIGVNVAVASDRAIADLLANGKSVHNNAASLSIDNITTKVSEFVACTNIRSIFVAGVRQALAVSLARRTDEQQAGIRSRH